MTIIINEVKYIEKVKIIKFSMSSFISFIVDYSLYFFINLITNNVIISNIIARLISCRFNYYLNRNIVFKDDKKITNTFLKYLILVIIVLFLNTNLLNILINMGFNKYISKLIIEISLFIISYLVQKLIIFRRIK